MSSRTAERLSRRLLPARLHRWLGTRVLGELYRPPPGMVDFGSLRRLTPVSREFGYDRGLPVDRYYVESFLSQRSRDITGRVLEVGDDTYTRQFGGGVVDSEVLHLLSGSTRASVVADLTAADNIPDDSYDCLILTQTLHLIYDVRAAVRTIERVLRPGGVLLATFPGITPISADAWSAYWCWAFTPLSATRLFHEVFKPADVTVEAFGNVLAATAFLQGLAAEELTTDELEVRDARYPVLVALRAVKGCGEPEPG
jgi:SAM-dependent methyltransferase